MKPTRRSGRSPVDWAQVRERLAAARSSASGEWTEAQARAILEERARHLARPALAADERSPLLSLVTFTLGGDCYAVEAGLVREVVRLVSLTPVPGTPPSIAGVINLRGELLPVVDLRKLLGLERPGITDLSRVVVLGRDRAEFGLLADSSHDLRSIPRSGILAPPGGPGPIQSRLLLGVTREALAVLDGAALLSDPRLFIGSGSGAQPDTGVGT